MAILETAGSGSWDSNKRAPRSAWSAFVVVIRISVIAACVGGIFFVAGFFAFLHSLDRVDDNAPRRADGIVALTGGAERISDAVDWLRSGGGRRLLISGVAPDMTRERLAHKAPSLREWLSCCIDLGHAARNTVGNAKETRHWVTSNGYRSVLVVTSSYHMPRALVELRRQLPGIALVPTPVVTERMKAMDFWQHPRLLKTIAIEYSKFLVAYGRASLTPTRPMGEISDNTTRRRV